MSMDNPVNGNGLLYFWQKLKVLFNDKVDKETGKGLSANDFTDTLKNKLDGIEAEANKYIHPASGVSAGSYGTATKVPAITVDVNGHVTGVTETTITGVTPASHTHGNITNGGAITAAGVTLADGDAFVISDASDSSKLKKSSITIGTGTTTYLRNDGTWEVPYTHPSYTARTGKPSANATPGFGDSVTISQIKSDATGHVTAATDRTITIPSATASSSANGLMSSTDKSKLDAFGPASDYALKSDITAAVRYKGTVATVANLPSTGQSVGDMYNVDADGHNYVWNGTTWDDLGGTWRFEALTNAEIDTILAS